METTLKIRGNFNELKTKLKQKYSNLTDADLTFSQGNEGELVTRLSKKLGKTEDEITDLIDELQSGQKEGMNKTEKSETERK